MTLTIQSFLEKWFFCKSTYTQYSFSSSPVSASVLSPVDSDTCKHGDCPTQWSDKQSQRVTLLGFMYIHQWWLHWIKVSLSTVDRHLEQPIRGWPDIQKASWLDLLSVSTGHSSVTVHTTHSSKIWDFLTLPLYFVSLPFFKSILLETLEQRHTFENTMFLLANVSDKCTLLWQTFALEISQLSHHENRDIASLVNFQCNAILWFYLVPSSMTSPHAIILTLRKRRNLSDYTQRETYTSNCPPLLLLAQSINCTIPY